MNKASSFEFVIQHKAYKYSNVRNVVKMLIEQTEKTLKDIEKINNLQKHNKEINEEVYKNLILAYVTFVLLYDKRKMMRYTDSNLRKMQDIHNLLKVSKSNISNPAKSESELAKQTLRLFLNFAKKEKNTNFTKQFPTLLAITDKLNEPISNLIKKLIPAVELINKDVNLNSFKIVLKEIVTELKNIERISNFEDLVEQLDELLKEASNHTKKNESEQIV